MDTNYHELLQINRISTKAQRIKSQENAMHKNTRINSKHPLLSNNSIHEFLANILKAKYTQITQK